MQEKKKIGLIYEDLSYEIIGVLYAVHNKLGGGFLEKYYQNAIRLIFQQKNIPYIEQVRKDIIINGKTIGRYYIDFIVDHKIVLEIKAKCNFSNSDIHQVLSYLKESNIEVAILANFSRKGLVFKRILRGFHPRKSENSENSASNYPRISEGVNP